MQDRFDALGVCSQRPLAFTGDVLNDALDDELQRLVTKAAERLTAPIALVSLVLDHIQYFRAHTGLPKELATSRATDRNASFCQLVVRDGRPLVVNHASRDDRVPQELVRLHGIEAYAGVPVHVGAQVVGSLCVIDTRPRAFDDEAVATLQHLARKVDQRLIVLANSDSERQTRDTAMRPAFAEMRNHMTTALVASGSARMAATALRTVLNIHRKPDIGLASCALDRAPGASMDDLETSLRCIEQTVMALTAQVRAMETAQLNTGESTSLNDSLSNALELSNHFTKLVGGVHVHELERDVVLRIPKTAFTTLLAALLAELAESARRSQSTGLELSVVAAPPRCELRLKAQLSPEVWQQLARTARRLAMHSPSVGVHVEAEQLALSLPCA